ncbi:hypothetical protein [Alicyclobacillus macrosporangiidus]|uniref:Uncharacterized protein n=1 Tax=Alicyclobacillus macrosporangiidus TaxID=392015 RepID=A0A1I7KD53_9BACL|nr:hypothetical protein [Alicyclobacillus macrosporangiidus]SFU95329.1 hypothetical protein SAMN05421543_11543 [Alicyclobacillus macrosporangiidus]
MGAQTNSTDPSQIGLNTLSSMGIHPVSMGGMMGKINTAIATVYQGVSSFALTYGGMFLVIAGLAWLIGWKFHSPTLAGWAKRVVTGVFVAEIIIVLLPQVYFSFLAFLSHM